MYAIVYYPTLHTALVFDRIGLAEPFFGSQISWNYHYSFQYAWMVFREHKLTFKWILSWFTQEIAFCQLFGSGRLAKINFWFGNFTKSVILYLIQKVYFCEPKKDVYYPNEEENQNRQPVWRNTWNICIASPSQSFPRRTLPCWDYLQICSKNTKFANQ